MECREWLAVAGAALRSNRQSGDSQGQARISTSSPQLTITGKLTSAKLRSQSWWVRFFLQIGLEENETAAKKFDQAISKKGYMPSCQVFHLMSYS